MSEETVQEVKGQWRGNPDNINRAGGPPKTHWWSTLLMEEAEKASLKMEGLKRKEVMAQALVEKAEAGDIAAIKEFGDRVQGKAPQAIDAKMSGDLHVTVTNYADRSSLPIPAATVPIALTEGD